MSCTRSSAFGLQASGTWACDNCHYVNKARENECGKCPSARPDPYAFRSTASSTRVARLTKPASSSAAVPARRLLRSSAAAGATSPLTANSRTSKRTTRPTGAQQVKVTAEEAMEEYETERIEADRASDSDDESLQERYSHRPKRHCAQQTQQRLNSHFKATKPIATTATTDQPTSKRPQPPTDHCLPHQLNSTAEPTKPRAVEQMPAAVVISVPAAFSPPPLAATPFVPATRDETITLLNRVHATLALSAFPTTTSSPLPSRTLHLAHLCSFLSRHLTSHTPAALYIAGRPGVGKTLTADWALQTVFGVSVAVLGSKGGMAGGGGGGRVWRYGGKVKGRGSVSVLPVTTVVTVNAIAMMKGHGSFWCKLLALLTTNSSRQHDDLLQLPADEALHRLTNHINNTRNRHEMILLVVDEIDALLSSSASASASGSMVGGGSSGSGGSLTLLHALFRLVYGASSCVVLLSISNNITLLDSHCSTLAATNSLPERVVFSTYSQADLLCILQERLLRCLLDSSTASTSESPVALPFFAPAALDFICKATSKDTGDIRRCLRDCRHAIQQLLTSCTATPATTPFSPASCQLTVSSLARVKAEREAATQHGRLSELSVQQVHVLWVLGLVGGVVVGKAGECYRRCVSRVKGSGLTELSGSEVCAVLEMLESEGMVRKDKQGKVVRYVSVVTVERMRRQLRGDIWDALLWTKAELIQSRA